MIATPVSQTDPAWSPTKVIVVDVDHLDEIPEVESGYARVAALVCRAQRPIGLLTVPAGATESLVEAVRTLAAETGSTVTADPVADAVLPSATVVVPSAFSRLPELRACLESLLALDYPDFDIVVVDNRKAADPRDHIALTAGLHGRIRVVSEPKRGGSAARNRGLADSRGEVVAFTDDDVVVSPGWLRHIGAIFATAPAVGVVTGSILPKELETESQEMFERLYGGFNRGFRPRVYSVDDPALADGLFPYAPGRFGTGANMAFRRDLLLEAGGFDEALGPGTIAKGGEDLGLFIDLIISGSDLAVEPAAYVFHTHRRTHEELLRLVRDYGIGLGAMYTSLILHNPRHLSAILRRFPGAAGQLGRSRNLTVTRIEGAPVVSKRLLARQLSGLALGPAAYLASRMRFALAGTSGRAVGGRR